MQRLKFAPSSLSAALAVVAVCVLAAAGALMAAGPSRAADDAKNAKANEPRPALTVTTTQPTRTSLALRLPANGNVTAWQEASIGTESSGLRLTDVRVNVGDTVRAGQVLATFAPETLQADVAQARASLLEARASAAEAAANAERARTLQATGALSQQQIQQYATAGETAQARVEAAQAALNAQQLRLKHAQVLAPDSGVISSRTATVGAVLGGGTELFRMVRKGRLEWRAEVTSSDLPRIRPGSQVNVTASSGAQVPGTVRMIAPTVDPQTRNGLVYVDLPSIPTEPPPGRPKAASAPSGGSEAHAVASVGVLLPGMFARGEFLLGERDAMSLPQSAVVVRDGFSSVFEVGEGSRVVMRRVQTGQRTGDRVEIVSGLQPGATVVERGGAFLNDGDLVRAQAAAPAKAPTAAPAVPAAPAAPATSASKVPPAQ
ncbi:efflux RND transporter periplasmic adaptor subunit [Acidovorax sp. SUPP3334]|uniref:efflux RND transporter periplasmic adaptor subunit n=1 Tax=Acidovorax sp. SUPP3334 TaxID=2920881 RepID=UPI0023DE389B|nr:efflux RND transporter periplasmic adaptor subunit [Acidovorax sp. SUPP3334]GKT22852.1 efflux RND transporter periplasmic adaptor subunit [Acidovorax sp. SUPP3334]